MDVSGWDFKFEDDVLKQLEDRQNDIVHVAEARGLRLLCVVKAA